MSIKSLSILLAASLAVGCAAQSNVEGDDPSTLTASTSESALSTLGKQLVGDYKSAALYPRFSLLKDGTYTWDSGIRCVKAPCPSGDTGKFSLWTGAHATRYLNLFSSDGKISRWLRVDSTKPATLVGVFGTTGTFTKVSAVRVGSCSVSSDCANGEQCEASICTARPLCAQVTTTDGTIHAKNFAAGSFAEADAWAATTAAGASYGISLATCSAVATGLACGEVYQPTCAFVSGSEAATTYSNGCEANRATIAAAGEYGEGIAVAAKGACTKGDPRCSTFIRSSEGSAQTAYYVHDFGSQFEADGWITLNPGAEGAAVLNGKCEDFLICPTIYKPVCGGVRSETAHTFSNSCVFQAAVRESAATDGWSKGYSAPGACTP